MNNNSVKVNSFKAWLLAARPKTLSGAAVPVLIGTALAWHYSAGSIAIVPTILCFAFAFIMQIDANFINDYFDFIRGNDDDSRLGPPRACAQGWVTPPAMKKVIIATTTISCIIGLPLVLYGGAVMILIGLLCVVFCFLYTTCLASRGLGDLLVLVFFGVVPVCITYFLEMSSSDTPNIKIEVIVASIACGLVVDSLLIVNNFRDIENDRKAGKNTLIVRVGEQNALWLYLWVGIVACLLNAIFLFYNMPWAFLLPLLYIIFHIMAFIKMMRIGKGRELNLVLADTARNMFVYGLLVSIGIVLG